VKLSDSVFVELTASCLVADTPHGEQFRGFHISAVTHHARTDHCVTESWTILGSPNASKKEKSLSGLLRWEREGAKLELLDLDDLTSSTLIEARKQFLTWLNASG